MKRLYRWLTRLTAYRVGVWIGIAFTTIVVLYPGHADLIPIIGKGENILNDWKFKLRGDVKPSGDVVVVEIDDTALTELGLWPLPHGVMAKAIDNLTNAGVKAIVFDETFHDKIETKEVIDKLRKDFAEVALTNEKAAASLAALKAGATGPAAESLAVLDKFRELQQGYSEKLATAAGGESGDALLADAVHRSPAVVLGAILLTPHEVEEIKSDAERLREIKAVSHVGIPHPTLDPGDVDELTTESAPIEGVPWHTFPGAQSPLEELLVARTKGASRTQLSFFNTKEDNDGVIRREPLVLAVGDPAKPKDELLVPNIDLGAILKYDDADPGDTRLWATKDDYKGLEYVAVLKGSAGGVNGAPKMANFRRIRVDDRGQLLLNYYGPHLKVFNSANGNTLSLADVVAGRVQKGALQGKIALVGATATGTYDQRVTPFDSLGPGVFIHATAIENILHDQYLIRPWWAGPIEAAILLLIALVVGRLLASVPVTLGLPVMFLTAFGYYVFDYFLFRNFSIAIFSAVPMLEVSSIFIGQTIFRYVTEERAKQQIRRTFEHYLNPSVIEEMVGDPSKLKLGGEKRVLSVMFSDIRGFTTISEKLSPEELAKLINEYLTPMTSLVFEHGGTLDKYIGDALMAIWGAPMSQEDHALRCCKTAVAMMAELKRLQDRWRAEGRNYPPIDVGIGINSGPMVVGNMGGAQRFDYTVLGDNVNLASRLEGTNKEYRSHIIISQNTYAMVEGQVAVVELGAVRVKGKKEPVRIYELLDDKPASGQMVQIIALFNEAVALFKQQQWSACREKCRAVLAIWPEYGPPKAYLDFCTEYEATPPPPDWDGVYQMTHK